MRNYRRNARQFKESFKNEYEMLRWIVFVFVGGAFNSLIIHLMSNYYLPTLYNQIQNQQNNVNYLALQHMQTLNQSQYHILDMQYQVAQQTLYQLYAIIGMSLSLIFITPILLSIGLTLVSPEKRIVPPFFIQLISLGAYFFYIQYDVTDFQTKFVTIYMLILYATAGGVTQDRIVGRLVGLTVGKENMEKFSLMVNTDLKTLESILVTPHFRTRLQLRVGIQDIRDGLRMKSHNKADFNVIMDLIKTSDENKTLVNAVLFDKGRYYFKKSDDLTQFARTELGNLQDIVSQRKELIQTESMPETNADYLINDVIEEVSGISVLIKQTSTVGWFKVGMFIAALIAVGVIYFELKDNNNTIIALILIILYLAFELPSRFGKIRRLR